MILDRAGDQSIVEAVVRRKFEGRIGFGLTTGKVKDNTPTRNPDLTEIVHCAGQWPGPERWFHGFQSGCVAKETTSSPSRSQ